MGRSVSRPTGAVITVYGYFHGEDQWDWDELVSSLRENLAAKYPSLLACSQWLGREDKAILENGHGYIGVSEYCGLVCVWAVVREFDYREPENREQLAGQWFARVEKGIHKTVKECLGGELQSLGHASNGEQFFEWV